jgi:hypothetical protein
MKNSKIQKWSDFGRFQKPKVRWKNSKRLPDFYIGFSVCHTMNIDSCLKILYFISSFVICIVKYTHTCALGTGFKLVDIKIQINTCFFIVMIFMLIQIKFDISYIKATVVSVCLSVRAVSKHCLDRQTDTTVVCFVEGGGSGKLRNFLIWEFRSVWQLLPNWQRRGPKLRWPKSSIKDLNRDSQYPVQTSRQT